MTPTNSNQRAFSQRHHNKEAPTVPNVSMCRKTGSFESEQDPSDMDRPQTPATSPTLLGTDAVERPCPSKRPAPERTSSATEHKRLQSPLRDVATSDVSTHTSFGRHTIAKRYDLDTPGAHDRCPSTEAVKLGRLSLPTNDVEQNIDDPVAQLQSSEEPLHSEGKDNYPGITSQPDFSPISQHQLALEVMAIYAGLVMVEAKSINVDSQKAAHPDEPLSTEQWQALVALHRTLLYEHYNFLMATQHPSANDALLCLAQKYSMPARMWKHGIHAFLEVLRHRRPESQEYMLAFIYLAYQMMSLLLETVPGFTDTWIECLGDLARYRMAIEEDREIHVVWGGIAGRWYVKAADRHPKTGRLYHHSGILERPSLRKFYLYARALTSVDSFLNAKESLGTLCSLILNDEKAHGVRSAETSIICFHARVFDLQETRLLKRDADSTLTILTDQPDSKIATFGVYFAVTNIAALLGFGTPVNILHQLYDSAPHCDVLASPPSRGHASGFQLSDHFTFHDLRSAQCPAGPVIDFFFHSFNDIIRRRPKGDLIAGLLPYVHTTLVFVSSINNLRFRLCDSSIHTLDRLLHFGSLNWSALSQFLNLIAKSFPITSRTEAFAHDELFPCDGIPLKEDYMTRGLEWTQWSFASDWFDNIEDDDGSRYLEDDTKRQHRAARILYLAMILAKKRPEYLSYDCHTRQFSDVNSDHDGDYVMVHNLSSTA